MEQQIAALAVEAVRDHGISQHKILSAIRSALREASDGLPGVRVLFNACHGGYGLSRAFKDWLRKDASKDEDEDEGEDDSNRVRLAGCMKAFGAHVARRHPSIATIRSVAASPAGKALTAALSGASNSRAARETLADIDDNLRALDKALATIGSFSEEASSSQTGMSRYTLMADCTGVLRDYNLQKFTRASAQTFRETFDVAALRAEFLATAEDMGWSTGLPPEVVTAIVAYRDPPKPEGVRRSYSKQGFMDAFVDAAGDGDRVVEAWFSCQSFVAASTAAFLAGFLSDTESAVHRHYLSAPGPRDDSEEEVGLLGASDSHARLAIEEVPRLAGWYISEYDGLENVIDI
jgi:hypothetical protein